MKKLSSMNDVPAFAIAGESKAAELYMKMATTAENPWMRKTLESFAQEELPHHKKLKAVRAGSIALECEGVGDLGLAEQEAEHKHRFELEYESLTY